MTDRGGSDGAIVTAEEAAQAGRSDRTAAELFDSLTPGERECLHLVASAMVSKEIARSLGISPHTVDARLRTAARKLGAANRFVAAQWLVAHQKSAELATAQTMLCDEVGPSREEKSLRSHAMARLADDMAEDNSDRLDNGRSAAAPPPVGQLQEEGPPSHSVGWRLLLISGVAFATFSAFTVVVYSLVRLSRLLASL